MGIPYYKDAEDPLFDQLVSDASKETKEYLKEAKDFLFRVYSCTFTQFIQQLEYPEYSTINYWENLQNKGIAPQETVDDLFYEVEGNRRRRNMNRTLF